MYYTSKQGELKTHNLLHINNKYIKVILKKKKKKGVGSPLKRKHWSTNLVIILKERKREREFRVELIYNCNRMK